MAVTSIAWSPDGSLLASSSYDGTVRIWDSATFQCTFSLYIHSPPFLQFDQSTADYLYTIVGIMKLGSTDSTVFSLHGLTMAEPYGYGLSNDSFRITYNGFNLLWLPAE